jgi:hypothetical protein
MTADNRNNRRNDSNHYLVDSDNNSDNLHSLYNVFISIEQDGDSTNTNINFEFTFKGLDKRISENKPTDLEKSKVDN